jgi:hypothetical protein
MGDTALDVSRETPVLEFIVPGHLTGYPGDQDECYRERAQLDGTWSG